MDNMQLWLSSSTDSINLNDRLEGFYLNPDLDGLTGLPEIRSVNGLNAGYDGGWTATQLWAARLITIRGVIAINDKAAVETKRKALAKLLSQGKNEDLELKFVSEAGNTYTATVRTTNCTMALQRVFWRQEYQIQLRANDPLIYDDGGSELVAILRVMSGEGGFEIPFDIPFDIGGTVTPTSIDVGDEATYPLIRLKGDLHNPTIISLTTNQRMQVLADIITTAEWHDYTTAYTTNGYTQIDSTEDGAPLSLTHLYGNAEQNGTPTPDAPVAVQTVTGLQTVKITGKNIFDKDSVSPINAYIASNGSIGYSAPDRLIVVPVNPNTTYTITAQRVGQIPEQYADDFSGAVFTSDTPPTVGSVGRRVFWGAADTYPRLNQTFTTSATENWLAIKVANVQRSDYAGSLATIQLEINDQATPFEPYQAQSQEINLGKNLFDTDTAVTRFEAYNGNAINDWGTYQDGIVTIVKSNGAHGTCAFAGFKPKFVEGQTYTLSAQVYLEGTNASKQLRFGTVTNSNTAITIASKDEWLTVVKTFTATDSDVSDPRIDIQAFNTGNTLKIKEIQLEAGAQATTYSAYKTPIELAKIGTYQDYIWNDDGTWKIHKAVGKVVLTGDASESWAYVSGAHARFQYSDSSIALEPSTSAVGAVMSDHFTASSTDDIYNGIDGKIGVHATIHQFWFSYLAITDLNGFKAWLSAHNTTVYYALATPTDTEITDSELIAQLNHIYSLYQGQNNLWLIPSAGAQGEMTVTYATAVDRDYHEVVIDCQARTVTQDGRNLYPALADGSEFIRLLPGENRLYLTSEVESDNGTAEVKFKKGNISI